MRELCGRPGDVDDVIKELIARGVVGVDAQPVALCYDMDALKETLLAMKTAFPPHFLHAIAIKSNPLPFFLRYAVDLGFGLECASIAEVVLALRQGCAPNKIMFDSPAKSKREITFALRHNVQLNADNFFELGRIIEARTRLQCEGVVSASHVGVRVNPLMGLGSIKALSVSDVRSKFGIPLNDENRPKIVEQFKKYSWLDSLHIHVGSQGCSMQQHASGAARLAEFVNEIEDAVGAGRIRVIDIGGGLPVNFGSDEVTPQYGDYSKILRDSAPALFSKVNRTIVTEYGRSVSAKAAWAVCAVEYVKKSGDGLSIAVIQAGADLFMRTCYCPQNFPLRISTHSETNGKTLVSTDKPPSSNGHGCNGQASVSQGDVSEHERGTAQLTTIAGPLCFGGDKVAEEVMLPEVREGDFVVVHDAGANTLSTFSRYFFEPHSSLFDLLFFFAIARVQCSEIVFLFLFWGMRAVMKRICVLVVMMRVLL
jgi:diaminopimelate decarboxylase